MDSTRVIDGPMLIGEKVITLLDSMEIFAQDLDRSTALQIVVNNETRDTFQVPLKSVHDISTDHFDMPDRLLAIADIEGNFNGFSSLLQNHGVIDQDFDWTFGSGHLVINGDLVDRAPYVTGILWLLYKLEQQAEDAGGKVHVILGNHDIMNIQGLADYAHFNFQQVAKRISGNYKLDEAFQYIFSDRTEFGKWLRTKNAITKIGPFLFVHGGISQELLAYDLSVRQINQIIRENLHRDFYFDKSEDPVLNAVMGRNGPIWFRGLAKAYDNYPKSTEAELDLALQYFEVERMVIGHTVVDDIMTDYHNKLIKIDVLHGHQKNTGKTKGLWIEEGKCYNVNDIGTKELLF